HVLVERRQVDGDIRTVATVAQFMQRPRGELLAGAGLTQDEHGAISRRSMTQQVVSAVHRRTATDEMAKAKARRLLAEQCASAFGQSEQVLRAACSFGPERTAAANHLPAVRQMQHVLNSAAQLAVL